MKPIFLMFILISLTGCDRYYGVIRTTEIDHVVDHNCIKEALERIDVITDISYKFNERGRSLTSSGFTEPEKVHLYSYRTPEINCAISLTTNYQGISEIYQSYGDLNKMPPQADIDKIRLLMDRIELAVGQSCDIKNIKVLTKETCLGVKCEPLE